MKILVTGSSGYVASDLIPRLQKTKDVCGIDVIPSKNTNIRASIDDESFRVSTSKFEGNELCIINLAAARFDFGATADDYLRLNVECHEKFLKLLSSHRVKKFIHISSVAAFDGRDIPYSAKLNCDDAYRSTKYIQEKLISDWCEEREVELIVLYPSAIFSKDLRSDTNIGKLQSISKYLPFVPLIDVVKSLTFLPNFSRFIIDSVINEIPAGNYLTIEKPSLTVSKMIQIISGKPVRLVRVPCLRLILEIVANFLYVLGGFGRIDVKLTPNRVIKLFADTSYSDLNCKSIDQETYIARNENQLSDLLKNFKGR